MTVEADETRVVVHFGPDLREPGGIAQVIHAYFEADLRPWKIDFVSIYTKVSRARVRQSRREESFLSAQAAPFAIRQTFSLRTYPVEFSSASGQRPNRPTISPPTNLPDASPPQSPAQLRPSRQLSHKARNFPLHWCTLDSSARIARILTMST